MKQCGHRFDFVGVVSGIVTKLLQVVDFRQRSDFPSNNIASSDANPLVSRTPAARPKSWIDFVNTQPNLYFRLSVSLDYALSKGKYPSEDELPGWVTNPSQPQTPTKPMEFPSLANCVSTMTPEDSVMRNRSVMQAKAFNLSQQFLLNNSIFISSHSSSGGYSDDTDIVDETEFGLWNSTETSSLFNELGGISRHTGEDASESPFSSNFLPELFDLPATGG